MDESQFDLFVLGLLRGMNEEYVITSCTVRTHVDMKISDSEIFQVAMRQVADSSALF